MKFLFDFFPVLAFYIAYKVSKDSTDDLTAMLIATSVIMLATIIQIAITWFKHRKVQNMHVIMLVLVLIFGSATIISQDQDYLIWKVSVTNWLFAAAFLISHFIKGNIPLVKRMMQHAVELPEVVWYRLSYLWITFFVTIGGINLAVAYSFGLEFTDWVDFKLFGMIGLTFAFVIIQAFYLSKHIIEAEDNGEVSEASSDTEIDATTATEAKETS